VPGAAGELCAKPFYTAENDLSVLVRPADPRPEADRS
jgi:hypothetical protein